MKRRTFVQIVSAGAVGLSLPALPAPAADLSASALARPAFLTRLGGEALVHRLGTAYLEASPGERDPQRLAAAIAAGRHEELGDRAAPGIEDRIRRDFEASRTVCVDGWILARTEARQCALFTLLHS